MDSVQLEGEYAKYQPLYKDFQSEVFEFVETFLAGSKLDIAEVKQRRGVKTFESLKENFTIHNKYRGSKNIFDIKDIAGIRVVCHCEDDFENATLLLIGALRERYSNVVLEMKGDENNHGKSRPSYRANHLTFTKSMIADGKAVNISCEVQVKTVMDDAWATQDRKYIYGKHVEGEAHDLTDSVATIMKGCEGLWSLVKSKSLPKSDEPLIALKLSGIKDEVFRGFARSVPSPTNTFLDEWFGKHFEIAKRGFESIKKPGYMQIRTSLPNASMSASKQDLKDAAKESIIHTFGWPIALFLEGGKPEYAPKPDEEGIFAEILVNDAEGDGRTFDYWAINENGAFYLLKSLFEDDRKPGELFFNTRIVRITETLMYLRNLYTRLGVHGGEEISIEITYGGLKGRVLTSSTPNRFLHWERRCAIEKKTTKITTTIDEIEADMVSVVEKFTEPLFEQFDFFILGRDVLADIVTNYVNGKVV